MGYPTPPSTSCNTLSVMAVLCIQNVLMYDCINTARCPQSLDLMSYKHFFHNTSQKNISISHFFRHF